MEPKISIHVDLGRLGKEHVMIFSLEQFYVDELSQKLDWPSKSADVCEQMLCTPQSILHEIKQKRIQFVNQVSRNVAEALTKALTAKDTEMGYPCRMEMTNEIL